MSEVVTFFAANQAKAGGKYALALPGGKRLLLYSRVRLDPALFPVTDKKGDAGAAVGALQGVGGLEVEELPAGSKTIVRVRAHGGHVPAKHAYLIDDSPDPKPRPLSSEIEVPLGDHLVVPVDSASEEELTKLSDLLRGLPGDTAAVMLGTLRRPGIEEGLERLEQRVVTLDARGRRLLGASLAGSATALVAVVVFGVLGLVRQPGPPADPSPAAGPGTTPAIPSITATTTTAPAPAVSSAAVITPAKASFDEAIAGLYDIVKQSKDPAIQALYASHFLKALPPIAGDKSMPAVWGIVKLSLLSASTWPPDIKWLALTQRQFAFAELPKIKDRGRLFRTLAYASCKAGKRPGVEGEKGKEGKEPWYSFSDKPCEEVDKDEAAAAAGVEELTKYVMSIPKPPQ